jgi:hypothetical protein
MALASHDLSQELSEAGRTLGHDLYHHSRQPRHADWPAPVLEGFDAAAHVHGHRRGTRTTADRFDRKWLQLRLGALRRGRVVAADVTPALIAELDVAECPVTRVTLTHGTQADTDWSIDRLNNDAAYAASNLAVMSVRANRAKGARCFAQVQALSEQTTPAEGLEPVEWLRLAALMLGPAFATCPQQAPTLPLCAPLPLHAVRLAQQQIQRLFADHATRPAGKNRLVRDFRPACTSQRADLRLRTLADTVHDGLKHVEAEHACDVWLQPQAMDAFSDWRQALDERGWRSAAAIAGQLSGARRETAGRLQAWRLGSGGYARAA